MNKYTKISITMLTISFSILMVQFLYGYVQNIESEVLNTENEEILESIDFEPNNMEDTHFYF